ncbi:myotubularin-related protein 2 [Reticulomyxa filosa]|uniref:Myotubularin-related protein 2 n=1 Tax=Reticulomyxa filosa TaxID=46433 RepID=X6P5V1_RETFI|nr:myotubularin-related protein 2 [Reticulomyxa filosa]|eukprot:ETO33581.1 myotubularin-related protein 2 [Reticulomyxa filosa]
MIITSFQWIELSHLLFLRLIFLHNYKKLSCTKKINFQVLHAQKRSGTSSRGREEVREILKIHILRNIFFLKFILKSPLTENMSRRSMSHDLSQKSRYLRKLTESLPKAKRKTTSMEDRRESKSERKSKKEEESRKVEMNILAKKWSYVFEDEILHRESFHNDHKTSSFRATYILSRNNKIDVCSDGHLTVTNYLMFFEPEDDNTLPGGSQHLIFPLTYISKISVKEKPKMYPSKSTCTADKDSSKGLISTTGAVTTVSSATTIPVDVFELEITTRRYRSVKFQVDKSVRMDPLMEMFRTLVFPEDVRQTFAFAYAKKHPVGHKFAIDRVDSKEKESLHADDHDEIWSWTTYDVYQEFKRMGVSDVNADTSTGDCRYRCTKVNNMYEVCDTYPRMLYVPMSMKDEEIKQVALFRKKGRIPAMTWKECTSNVALFRCSQPQVGVTGQRSNADEWMLEKIVEANDGVSDSVLYVMDARPKLNAQLNKAKGAGFENAAFYKNIIVEFLNIANIHVMRKSRQALSRIIHAPKHKDKDWWVQLANTEWLQHIRKLLKGTHKMVSVIKRQEM